MIYPGAVWRPGVNAGYRAGRSSMETVVCHYTVGRASAPIGDRGYFHFLIGRDGTVTQFCEADAVAWHAGDPWNSRGPGIEIEYLDEATIFTPAQHAACAALIAWLPIPHQFYDGPRLAAWDGYITHRSLLQSGDAHSDYWDRSDWDAMTAPAATEEPDMSWLIHEIATGKVWVFNLDTHTKTWLRSPDALTAQINVRTITNMFRPGATDAHVYRTDENDGLWANLLIDARDTDTFAAVTPPGAGGAGAVPLTVTLTGTATPA